MEHKIKYTSGGKSILLPVSALLQLPVLAFLLLCASPVASQTYPAVGSSPSGTHNYILTRTFRIPVSLAELGNSRTIDQENQSIRYFDGLGRPVQEVDLKGSPTFKDVVTHIQYDGLGRRLTDYLPYAEQSSDNGSFKA